MQNCVCWQNYIQNTGTGSQVAELLHSQMFQNICLLSSSVFNSEQYNFSSCGIILITVFGLPLIETK